MRKTMPDSLKVAKRGSCLILQQVTRMAW